MALMAPQMQGKDAVFGALAQCYVTIGGQRYNCAHATQLEAKAEKNKVEVDILGTTTKGNKAAGVKYTGSMTMHYNQSIFRKMMYQYQKDGTDAYFEIQVTNSDPTSAVGDQTITLKNCNLDDCIIAKFDATGEILDEEVNFTFEKFNIDASFADLDVLNK